MIHFGSIVTHPVVISECFVGEDHSPFPYLPAWYWQLPIGIQYVMLEISLDIVKVSPYIELFIGIFINSIAMMLTLFPWYWLSKMMINVDLDLTTLSKQQRKHWDIHLIDQHILSLCPCSPNLLWNYNQILLKSSNFALILEEEGDSIKICIPLFVSFVESSNPRMFLNHWNYVVLDMNPMN